MATNDVIQLPLSFMSSVFGMNAAEFDSGNSMSLGAQFSIMCKKSWDPISLYAFQYYLSLIKT